jgi:hypothetical protein
MYQLAGIDYMSVSPGWLGQAFSGNEDLVNTRYNELIQTVKKDFTGKIYVELPIYGFLEDKDGQENYLKYDYYKKADMVEVTVYELPQSYKDNSKNTAQSQAPLVQKLVKDLNQKAQEKSLKLSLNIKFYAYKDALNKGIFEFNDILNPKIKDTKADFDYQKDVYQAVFENLKNASSIERITTGGFWWDDALEPDVKVPVGVTPSIRNKPAEELIKIWFNK